MSPHLLDLTRSASGLCRPRGTVTVEPQVPAAMPPDEPLNVGRVARRAGTPDRRWRSLPQPVAAPAPQVAVPVRLVEVLGGMSAALDVAEGQRPGHAIRTTLIGMRIGEQLGLTDHDRSALLYTLLLKDLGGSANASRMAAVFESDDLSLKHAHRLTDWTAGRDAARYAMKHALPGRSGLSRTWHALLLGARSRDVGRELIQLRADRGRDLALQLGLPRGAADAIAAVDEHWDGNGLPNGTRGSGIPMLARIAGLAQAVDVHLQSFDLATAYQVARDRRARWFDPVLVDCLNAFRLDIGFWNLVGGDCSVSDLVPLEPTELIIVADETRLDTIAEVFAQVIDAKSPFTSRHSHNVAFLVSRTAREMGLPRSEQRNLRRAALLHDIGKLAVSNMILDKPGPLGPVEMAIVREHTRQGYEVLSKVERFRKFAATAASHHERLDGSGYHLGLRGEELGTSSRILAVADVVEAMTSARPWRQAMPLSSALARLEELVGAGQLCPMASEALAGWFTSVPQQSIPLIGEATSQAA